MIEDNIQENSKVEMFLSDGELQLRFLNEMK